MAVDHLRHERVHYVALGIHPFHIQRLILRLAVAGDRHHVAQCDGVLARIVVFAQSRRGEEFGHGERLEPDRQQRQGDIAQVLGHIAGDGLAQRLVVQHTAGDQRTLDRPVLGYAQQRAHLGDAAHLIGAHGHDLHIRDGHLMARPVDVGRPQPARRVAVTGTAPVDEVLGRDVVEFAAATAGIIIALVGHFIIHDWHASHYCAQNHATRHLTAKSWETFGRRRKIRHKCWVVLGSW